MARAKNSKAKSAATTKENSTERAAHQPPSKTAASDDTSVDPANAPAQGNPRRLLKKASRAPLQPTNSNTGSGAPTDPPQAAPAPNVGRDQPVAPAVAPPITYDAAIHEALVAKIAALEASLEQRDTQIQLKNATLIRLKSWEPKKALIPEPTRRPYNLRKAMQMGDDKLLYNACRATVRETTKARYEIYLYDWRKQDVDFIAEARALSEKRQPILQQYERGWATLEIMRTYMKGKRSYTSLLGKIEALQAAGDEAPTITNKKVLAMAKKGREVVLDTDDEMAVFSDVPDEEEIADKGKGKGTKQKQKQKRVVASSADEDSSSDDSQSDSESSGDSSDEEAPVKASGGKRKADKHVSSRKAKKTKA